MYTLTIFKNVRKSKKTVPTVHKKIETFEPPSNETIQDSLLAAGEGSWYDISRREFEPEDFDYREEV